VQLGSGYVATIVDLQSTPAQVNTANISAAEVPSSGLAVIRSDDPRSVVLGWLTSTCETSPLIVVHGSPQSTEIDLYRGPIDSWCGDVGIPRAIALRLPESPTTLNANIHD
jgi:hypothetical protein